jgi:hypothetical protein
MLKVMERRVTQRRKAVSGLPVDQDKGLFVPNDPSLFRGQGGEPLPLERMFRGATLFLLCSGPSAATLDLPALDRRGVMTMAVNNAWLLHRPNLWVGVDPSHRFADSGWRDPSILKFVPATHRRTYLRTVENGQIVPSKRRVGDCPNVAYFRRFDGFNPSSFFDLPVCGWGTLKDTRDSLGIKNSRTVMLAALWIAVNLGFTTINLLGCDFKMQPEKPYAFDEGKDAPGIRSNNHMYRSLTRRLEALLPHLASRKVSIFNANPDSSLTLFPHKTYATMIEEASSYCNGPIPSKGWYA